MTRSTRRKLFALPLALCLVAWAGSYWQVGCVGYRGELWDNALAIVGGNFYIEQFESHGRRGFYAFFKPPRPQGYEVHLRGALGLGVLWELETQAIRIPFWIPTALCATLVWWGWRRSGRDKRTAFEVEPGKA